MAPPAPGEAPAGCGGLAASPVCPAGESACGQAPRQPLPRIPGISSRSSSPFPGPSPHQHQALSTRIMPQEPTTLPSGFTGWGLFLPQAGGDRQQHGPVLFNVKIKDPFTSWVACLWSFPAGWQQGPGCGCRLTTLACGCTRPALGEWVEECSVVHLGPRAVAGRWPKRSSLALPGSSHGEGSAGVRRPQAPAVFPLLQGVCQAKPRGVRGALS